MEASSQRNAIASQMIAMLNAAAFDATPINEDRADDLIEQGKDLLAQMNGQQEDDQPGD